MQLCMFHPIAGFGLKMTEDTKRGEVVISVPRKCFMSTETAKDSSLSTLMDKDPMLKTMPNVALALHLVLEKNSPGFVTDAFLFTISFPLILLLISD